MTSLKYWYLAVAFLLVGTSMSARDFIGAPKKQTTNNNGNFRSGCIPSTSEQDLDINNVRARLRAGGDMWWDGTGNAIYVVPKVDPASGETPISSLFAGAIWLGAYDDGGNLILAAQTYRSSGNDYWPGPLVPSGGLQGTVEKIDCENWDEHFVVYGDDIDKLRADLFEDGRVDETPSRGLLGWPGRGNPYFASIHGFSLAQYDQDLAPFVDYDGDGIYDPKKGDHPVIEVTGCSNDYFNPVYADQMIWWVYNDNGNVHGQTQGKPMKMEIQVTAFGYRSTDAINDMTFYRYKLLNRNTLSLNNTYFSLWSDPDLGNAFDDYIGCDTVTGMGYVYNSDADDDATQNGYGTTIPALGVDYFRGPLDENGNQIGLSSFQYHINSQGPTGDPTSAIGYYRLISGYWPDGTPITNDGEDGYDPGSGATPTPFVFPSFPNDNSAGAWSMCTAGLGQLDARFMHTSGPFVLKPGATNELISGVVWVPEETYPCPSLKKLVEADELAQGLFDNCFKITDGPTAPYIDIIEMKNELVLNLSHTSDQNNYKLSYVDTPGDLRPLVDTTPGAPALDVDYNFQGYKVYQVNDPNISVTELNDETKSRMIFQTDLKDDITNITNWKKYADPDFDISIPTLMVEGNNQGIQTTFRVTEDVFTGGKLINHKPYYFCVIAYAYNEFAPFDPVANTGQPDSYLQGRKNFQIYTGIPRINDPEYNGVVTNAVYGDQPEISRLDGQGLASEKIIEIANLNEIEAQILTGQNVGKITYKAGAAPIDIKVVDPFRVSGTYRLYIYNEQNCKWLNDVEGGTWTCGDTVTTVGSNVRWLLQNTEDATDYFVSDQELNTVYEQYIPELGISLNFNNKALTTQTYNGAIGVKVTYADTTNKWFVGLEDNAGTSNMLRTDDGEVSNAFDPNQEFSDYEAGWIPFMLSNSIYELDNYYFSHTSIGGKSTQGSRGYLKPAHADYNEILTDLRNVNVVMTPDKSKWSRCVVVETANAYHYKPDGLGLTVPSGLEYMGMKTSPSVDKDGNVDTTAPAANGYSWFPGYAYDVETGERLNIFFGENSLYNGSLIDDNLYPGAGNGDDMLYNPSDVRIVPGQFGSDFEKSQFIRSVYGGQHIIYIAKSTYDSCKTVAPKLNSNGGFFYGKDQLIYKDREVMWSSMAWLANGSSMTGEAGNIPPNEATFKIRIDRPFELEEGIDVENTNGFPLYEFSLEGFTPVKEDKATAESALDLINVVPNPYYAYSDYEVTELDNVIKVTNIPAKATVRIYTLAGRFVREYNIAQDYNDVTRTGIARLGDNGSSTSEAQVLTSVEWDLENNAGVPVGSGVYLIHVTVPGVGERVLKSFIINRAFDAQKL